MNRFRTVSAIMRSYWCIEPVWAEHHLPLLNGVLSGDISLKQLSDEEDSSTEGDETAAVSRYGYAIASTGIAADSGSTPQTRYALDDPELPEDSILVLDIRGAIMKESSCCSMGTEDYVTLLNQAYAHDKIIGIVCLIDSPGGQLSGTPSLFDAIRNPQKPTVSVINEGLMASAAYWLACGSDFIYATQKSDQIGSIGVFVQFNDTTEAKAKLGIKTITVYSDRSPEKNLPFRDALAGDDTLLREDLNYAADLFRESVEAGRGDRLKPAAKNGPDVFKGAVFYASKAIELGLIDGFGNLDTAVAKVVEIHQTRSSQNPAPKPAATLPPAAAPRTAEGQDAQVITATTESDPAPETVPNPALTEQITPELSANSNPTDTMFGDKHKALTALSGREASSITDEELDAVNANLDSLNIKGVRLISTSYALEALDSLAKLSAASGKITELEAEVARLGKQPGAMGTRVTPAQTETQQADRAPISETDAELARLKSRLK